MKILYDHQIFTVQKYGGISRYFSQIISNLPETVQTEIGIKHTNNEYIKNLNLIPDMGRRINPIDAFIPKSNFIGKEYLLRFFNKYDPAKYVNKKKSIELLKAQNFDIFHPTYYDDYFLDYIGNKPFVLTIHDMIHELYPEMLKDMDTILRKANLASRAAHIIAVSKNTKKDIIEILNIKEEKISVIYHASSIQKCADLKTLSLPSNYIVYVGDRFNYKNFIFFVLGIKDLLNKFKDLMVIYTGSSLNKEEQKLINEMKLADRFIHFFVLENQFHELFFNAKAFVFPSYYEGFGIPIIEAFDCECPVILSNSSCFHEIAGDAAIYFEPKSKTQLNTAIEKILNDQETKELLIKRGKERLRSFSWTNSAKLTLDVYNNVLKCKNLTSV